MLQVPRCSPTGAGAAAAAADMVASPEKHPYHFVEFEVDEADATDDDDPKVVMNNNNHVMASDETESTTHDDDEEEEEEETTEEDDETYNDIVDKYDKNKYRMMIREGSTGTGRAIVGRRGGAETEDDSSHISDTEDSSSHSQVQVFEDDNDSSEDQNHFQLLQQYRHQQQMLEQYHHQKQQKQQELLLQQQYEEQLRQQRDTELQQVLVQQRQKRQKDDYEKKRRKFELKQRTIDVMDPDHDLYHNYAKSEDLINVSYGTGVSAGSGGGGGVGLFTGVAATATYEEEEEDATAANQQQPQPPASPPGSTKGLSVMSSQSTVKELVTVEKHNVQRGRNYQPATIMITSGHYIPEEGRMNNACSSGVTSASTSTSAISLQPIVKIDVQGTNESNDIGEPAEAAFNHLPPGKITTTGTSTSTTIIARNKTNNNNNNNSKDQTKHDSIELACQLIQDIYDQIILHDSPAVNESTIPLGDHHPDLATAAAADPILQAEASPTSKGNHKNHNNKVSKQRHDVTGGSAGTTTPKKSIRWSFDTEETNNSSNQSQAPTLEVHKLGGPLKNKGQQQHRFRQQQDKHANHSFFKHLEKQPESKMGHIALGTLCSWTLHTMQQQQQPNNNSDDKGGGGAVPAALAIETNLVEYKTKTTQSPQRDNLKAIVDLLDTKSPTGSDNNQNTNHDNNNSINNNKGKSNSKWNLKKVWKKKKKPISGTSAEIVVSPRRSRPTSNQSSKQQQLGGFPHDPIFSDLTMATNSVDHNNIKNTGGISFDGSASTTPKQIEIIRRPVGAPIGSSSPRRLQMFGSEYARYLSTSALAPQQIRGGGGSGSPRNIIPHKSASSRYGPYFSSATSRRGGGGRHNNNNNISSGIQQIMSTSSFGSGRSKTAGANNRTNSSSWNLEDQDNAILTGAIVDICITNGPDTPPPKGYYRISQTVNGEEFRGALRAGGTATSPRRRSSTYINVKKEPNWHRATQRPCVTALTIIYPDRQEFVPPGFCVVREHRRSPPNHHHGQSRSMASGSGGGSANSSVAAVKANANNADESDTTIKDQPANFNTGVPDGERVFLCFRRSREANPITGILPLQPAFDEAIPDGYTVLERSPRNFVASLNPKCGSPVFLAYRQRLANLEPLRPLPLLLSVPVINEKDEDDSQASGTSRPTTTSKKPKLSAYYCTGGTVVEANVGRYHIMDRSTHDLLSPSSVANRLSLIELSRRKSMPQLAGEYDAMAVNASFGARSAPRVPDPSPTKSYAPPTRELVQSSQESVASSTDRSNQNLIFGGCSSLAEYPKNSNASFSSRDSFSLEPTPMLSLEQTAMSSFGNDDDNGVPSVILSSFPGSNSQSEGYYPKLYDPELQQNHDALNFIPVVEVPAHQSQLEPLRHLRTRTALLTPILTSCYQRHGGAALKAVEGLTKLLTETEFFADDVDLTSNKASLRLTLLDIAVQVVCDVAMGGAQETTFGTCVEFVENAVRFSDGNLNRRTVGYVLRFYLFVFYFGASVPANNTFPHANWSTPRNQSLGSKSVPVPMPILYDPRSDWGSSYLPGGAPQLAALSFKELISLTMCRLQQVCSEVSARQNTRRGGELERQSMGNFISSIIDSVIDGAVHRVDTANFTQMAIHQIHRSGGSELFWHDMMTSCGIGLFGRELDLSEEVQNVFVITFAILANLVKVASGKIRTNAYTMEMRPRDVSSKLLALELLLHFLQQYGEKQKIFTDPKKWKKNGVTRCSETMIFSIRRLVVPCILANTRAGLEDPRVFQRMVQIMSVLWRNNLYRDRMKGEMGMLIEHFGLRLLRLGPQIQQSRQAIRRRSDTDDLSCPLLIQQVDLLTEIKRWFSANPKATIEMYLNFDTDITSHEAGPMPLLPGTQWKVFQRICASLCSLAEQCGDLIGEQIRQSQSTATSSNSKKMKIPFYSDVTTETQGAESKEAKFAEQKAIREGARRLRKAALDAIVQILKCLARTSAAASGRHFYSLVSSFSDPNDPDDFGAAHLTTVASSETDECSDDDIEGREAGAGGILKYWRKEQAFHQEDVPTPQNPKSFKAFTYNFESQSGLLSSVTRETAFEIARRKSVKKAIEYLIACNALTPSPRDIASFLRVHKDMLDQGALGTYLGESGIDGQENEYWNLIRFSYVRAISFDGMNVEEALRHFLTNCGFQLPGEAQKIDRIMSTFAQCYWEDNAGDIKNCPFQDQDTVFLLSFAIIMLNTDLHKSNLSSSNSRSTKGGRKRITKQEFLKNLSGVEGSEELKRDYLSAVYDSIEANPIILSSDEIGAQSVVGTAKGRERMLKSMLGNVRSADALLRGLSVHDVKWASMQDFSSSLDYEGAHALSDLTQSCISEAWHQFHGVVNTALETAHLDPQGMEPCVDLLMYALVVTICLDLPMERSAFLSQLGRFKVFEGSHNANQGHWVPDEEQGRLLLLKGNPAFDRAIAGPLDDQSKLKALVQVHEATQELRSALKVDIQVKREMNRVTYQILDGEILLNDPSRSFVRMGDLKKKSNKSGRFNEYRFYLFSDVLIYAKRISSNPQGKECGHRRNGSFAANIELEDQKDEYKIHEELPLHLMKVVDWFQPSSIKDVMKKAFKVHHPHKTFMVFCNTPEDRVAWVRDIRTAISKEIKRKVEMEAARMAAASMTPSTPVGRSEGLSISIPPMHTSTPRPPF